MLFLDESRIASNREMATAPASNVIVSLKVTAKACSRFPRHGLLGQIEGSRRPLPLHFLEVTRCTVLAIRQGAETQHNRPREPLLFHGRILSEEQILAHRWRYPRIISLVGDFFSSHFCRASSARRKPHHGHGELGTGGPSWGRVQSAHADSASRASAEPRVRRKGTRRHSPLDPSTTDRLSGSSPVFVRTKTPVTPNFVRSGPSIPGRSMVRRSQPGAFCPV